MQDRAAPLPAPSAPLGALNNGETIAGTYRVMRPIAEGGMASVYEVRHQVTGAFHALKVVRMRVSGDERLEQRLIQEARVGACIRSDHVAKVIDAGVDPRLEMPYIVMELLEGVALSEELRARGRFGADEAREILRQLCHALGAAHRAGIVHRDLKPGNLFLARSGTAGLSFILKVLDFGIAKVLADARADPLTLQVGTPAWMAPEQTEPDGGIKPSTDVWAIGLLAYSLLTGRSYWRSADGRASTAAILRELIVDPIVPATARATEQGCAHLLPSSFDRWFLKCVARDPGLRFPDAASTYEALQAVLPAAPDAQPVRLLPTSTLHVDASGEGGPLAVSAASERTTAVQVPRPRRGKGPRNLAIGTLLVATCAAPFALLAVGRNAAPTKAASASSEVRPSAGMAAPAAASASVLLRLRGSNTIGAELAPALAEAFLRRRMGDPVVTRGHSGADELKVVAESRSTGNKEVIEIAAHGSSTAFRDLAEGRCDVGMSSRPIHSGELTSAAALGDLSNTRSRSTGSR